MLEEIKKYLDSFGGSLNEEKGGLWVFNYQVAQRDTVINKTTVSFTAKFRILDDQKLVKYTEIVKEASSGLGVGGDMPMGVGTKTETYKVGAKGREGTVSEKSTLAGQTLEYKIDYREVRNSIKEIAEKNGYKFKYKILPFGL
mgnify:CR=1 FL=1